MEGKIPIKNKNGKNQLIAVDDLQKLLKSNSDQLTLFFECGKVDDEYRKSLQEEMSEYHIFNVRWMPEIWIYPAIETSKIIEIKDEIFKAATSFREDGIKLMRELGETYEMDPFKETGLFDLKKKSRETKQRGKVNEEWNFWFHGAECQFENHRTGQIVELVITNGSEFGALDSYFFLKYLETTIEFKELADFFSGDTKSVTKALNFLEDLGKLERINNISQRGIIVRSN